MHVRLVKQEEGALIWHLAVFVGACHHLSSMLHAQQGLVKALTELFPLPTFVSWVALVV